MSAKLIVTLRKSGEESARSASDLEKAQSLANAMAQIEEMTAKNNLVRQQVSDTAQLRQSVLAITQRE